MSYSREIHPTGPDETESHSVQIEPEIITGTNPADKDIYWNKYYQASRELPPSPILGEAITYVEQKENACDLGAGTLRDSVFLLDQGFQHVTAVDSSGPYKKIMSENKDPRITMRNDDLDIFELPPASFDLVSGQRVFHYTEGGLLAGGFIQNIAGILKKGGIFTTTVFSDKDTLHTSGREGFFPSKEQMENLLGKDFEIIRCDEVEKDGQTVEGKAIVNHVLEIIARKK